MAVAEDGGPCQKPDCGWVALRNLTGLKDVPHLTPNAELSGIGVILGFSITAYLILALLILHYIAVHDYHRKGPHGRQYANVVDRGILTFLRGRRLSWRPSKRFEYALEKAVIILSDTTLVTGLAFLVAGYSQLNCGLSAYHWQIMVYIAWFASFSFLSAMTFLEDYFQANRTLRIIRIILMLIMACMLIVALLPTGSHNWLNLYPGEGGFYPGLAAKCYYVQMGTDRFNPDGGPKIWSMVVSVLVVGLSYLHTTIWLLDPTAEFTRKYFRSWPGSFAKRLLRWLERKASPNDVRGMAWTLPYLLIFAGFATMRALYDILQSMLLEIIWLTFAMSWGTIKLWATRASYSYDVHGHDVGENPEVLEEDYWTFGQTLPLVLLLLPILSMIQAYYDTDAKAVEEAHKKQVANEKAREGKGSADHQEGDESANVSSRDVDVAGPVATPKPRNLTSGTIERGNRQNSPHVDTSYTSSTAASSSAAQRASSPDATPLSEVRPSTRFQLPQYPYGSFSCYAWYDDLTFLLILQILLVAAFALYFLSLVGSFLGISQLLRSRLFLIWILAMIPLSCLVHLSIWYAAAWIANALGIEGWFLGKNSADGDLKELESGLKKLRRRCSLGYAVYWVFRMLLICSLILFTFFLSAEIAGPEPIQWNEG